MDKIFPLRHHYHIRSGRNCFILFLFFLGGGHSFSNSSSLLSNNLFENADNDLNNKANADTLETDSLLSSGNENEARTSE